MEQPVVRVGVGVVILNAAGQFLMGKRQGAHGYGTWSCPGGHLEFGEDIIACARREAKEECGLDIDHVAILTVANHIFPETHKHYVTIYCIATAVGDALPVVCEPEKCDSWQFFDSWDKLPHPLFIPYETDIKSDQIAAYCRQQGLGPGL